MSEPKAKTDAHPAGSGGEFKPEPDETPRLLRHRGIDNNRPIPPGTVYFPQYLQKAGYATCFIGKWHMGGESDKPQLGWDHWVSFRGQGEYLPPSPDYTLNVDGQRLP